MNEPFTFTDAPSKSTKGGANVEQPASAHNVEQAASSTVPRGRRSSPEHPMDALTALWKTLDLLHEFPPHVRIQVIKALAQFE